MDREVSKVPGTRIGEGAQPGPNNTLKYVNPLPAGINKSSDMGACPPAMAMEKEVNSMKKGKSGGSAKDVGGWNARRTGKKK
jgi:hypothetical protein